MFGDKRIASETGEDQSVRICSIFSLDAFVILFKVFLDCASFWCFSVVLMMFVWGAVKVSKGDLTASWGVYDYNLMLYS